MYHAQILIFKKTLWFPFAWDVILPRYHQRGALAEIRQVIRRDLASPEAPDIVPA